MSQSCFKGRHRILGKDRLHASFDRRSSIPAKDAQVWHETCFEFEAAEGEHIEACAS